MKRITLLIAFLAAITASRAQVTVEASIDSASILIGQQTLLQLNVACGRTQKVMLPEFDDGMITDGLEIVEVVSTDTQWFNKQERMVVSLIYNVTSFLPDLYYIPPFEVQVDSQTQFSNSLGLKVLGIAIDTTEVNAICDIKPVHAVPVELREVLPLGVVYLLLLLFAILATFLIDRYVLNKPILRRVVTKAKLPAHEQALGEMARIKDEKGWMKEDVKEYYTELTDVLRSYIEERFGFSAREMTSDEIIEHLLEQNDEASIQELRELFQTSDLVKFAKHHPMMNENDMNLLNAIDFVNETKQETAAQPMEVEEVEVVKEGLSRTAKRMLVGGIVFLVLCALAALYFAYLTVYKIV